QTIDQVLKHPQLKARGMCMELEHPTVGTLKTVGCPVRIDGQSSVSQSAPPLLGQHTREILAEIGLDDMEF
ncbi:MAG TPA: CoA transferase, partial [Myxococcales bacterium]|nr:CoA transferase [Myxococcales bacterium]